MMNLKHRSGYVVLTLNLIMFVSSHIRSVEGTYSGVEGKKRKSAADSTLHFQLSHDEFKTSQ
jgi:hypothetical protein